MAIYHCEVKNISRGKGQNSLATLAYISGKKIKDKQTGKTYDYRRKDRVVLTTAELPKAYRKKKSHSGITAFQELEQFETADNARTAKHIIVALPREMTYEEDLQAVKKTTAPLVRRGYPVFIAIHDDPKHNNPHAHILLANRPMDERGHYVQSKTRTKSVFALDRLGQRIPVIDPKTGKQKVRKRKGKGEEKVWKRTTKVVDQLVVNLDDKGWLEDFRWRWEENCNEILDQYDRKIDRRSFADRGFTEFGAVPTIHEGYTARKMERQGQVSERCEWNRQVQKLTDSIYDLWDSEDERNALIEQRQKEQQQDPLEEWQSHIRQPEDRVLKFTDGTTADLNDLAREAIEEANEPEPPKKNPPKRRRKPYGGR